MPPQGQKILFVDGFEFSTGTLAERGKDWGWGADEEVLEMASKRQVRSGQAIKNDDNCGGDIRVVTIV